MYDFNSLIEQTRSNCRSMEEFFQKVKRGQRIWTIDFIIDEGPKKIRSLSVHDFIPPTDRYPFYRIVYYDIYGKGEMSLTDLLNQYHGVWLTKEAARTAFAARQDAYARDPVCRHQLEENRVMLNLFDQFITRMMEEGRDANHL